MKIKTTYTEWGNRWPTMPQTNQLHRRTDLHYGEVLLLQTSKDIIGWHPVTANPVQIIKIEHTDIADVFKQLFKAR